MEYVAERDPSLDTVYQVIEGLGYSVVDLGIHTVKRRCRVSLVVSRRGEGVTLEGCTRLHRTVLPVLEVALSEKGLDLQVSSPGVARELKSANELSLFTGRGVGYILSGETEWCFGTLGNISGDSVNITGEDGDRIVKIERIRRIKLRDSIG